MVWRIAAFLLLLPSFVWAASPTTGNPTVSTESSTVTTHNISVPACASGKLFLIFSNFDTNLAAAPTWPANANDSTVSLRYINSSANSVSEIRYRFANGSDAQIDVTTGTATRSAHHVFCISGAHASSPPEAPVFTNNTPATLTPDPPSVTPLWGSDDNLYFAYAGEGQTSSITLSSCPTNFTTGCTHTSHGSGTIVTGRRANTSSSEDPGVFTFTGTTATWRSNTVVVRPAAGAISPPTGFVPVTGNNWQQTGGIATPINGFSVLQWNTASGPAQQALWPITTIPAVGGTAQASFRIESPTQRYRCFATRNAGTNDDTMTLEGVIAGVNTPLAGPTNLGIDIQPNDEIGVNVTAGGAISCIYRSVAAAWATLCAGGGDYCIIVTGQTTTNPATSYIGMAAAPPVTATSFSGTLSAPGSGLPAPSVPENCVMVNVSNTTVHLDCDPSTGTVVGYRDRFCTGVNCTPSEQIRDSPAISWPVTDLEAVTTYCFDRCAHDGVTCSSFSTKACATTTDAPAASTRGTKMMLGVGH